MTVYLIVNGESTKPPFVDLWYRMRNLGPKILVAIVILVVTWLLARLVRRLVQKAIGRTSTQGHVDILVARGASAVILTIGVVLALWELGVSLPHVLTTIGLASLGVAFALQDILSNLFAGVILLIQHPFTMGDQIRVGDQEGTVENVRVRDTQIMTYDGERVYIPNRTVFSSAIINFTSTPSLRRDLQIGIRYAADIKEARDIAHKAMVSTPGVLERPKPVVLVESEKDYVVLVLRFWTESDRNRGLKVNSDITERVLERFQAAGIDFIHEVPEKAGGAEEPPEERADETQAMDTIE